MLVYQHQRTQSDENGNPRRMWLAWLITEALVGEQPRAKLVFVQDEGYGNLDPRIARTGVELNSVNIPVSEYEEMINWVEPCTAQLFPGEMDNLCPRCDHEDRTECARKGLTMPTFIPS